MSPVRNVFFSIFTPNETAPPTPGPFSSVAFNVSIFWVPRNSHYSSVFWSEAYSKISPLCKKQINFMQKFNSWFYFWKYWRLKVLYDGRQHLKKCLHRDHWLHSVKSPRKILPKPKSYPPLSLLFLAIFSPII